MAASSPDHAGTFKYPWVPERVFIGEQFVDVYDIAKPENKNAVPVVIVPGWVEVPASHRKHIERLVDHGLRVIAYDAPHGLTFDVPSVFGGYSIQYQKMETLVRVLKALQVNEADLVGRSEGGIIALYTKYYHPTLVRHIVLQNTAGLIGYDNIFFFLGRWLRDQKQMWFNDEHDPPPYAPVPAVQVMAQNWLRTGLEIWALVHSRMRRALEYAARHGTKVAVVHTQHDRLFPVERVKEHTARLVWDFRVLYGSHTSYFSRPKEFGDAIAQTIERLRSDN